MYESQDLYFGCTRRAAGDRIIKGVINPESSNVSGVIPVAGPVTIDDVSVDQFELYSPGPEHVCSQANESELEMFTCSV